MTGGLEPNWRNSNWVEGLYLSDIYTSCCEAGVSVFTDSIFQPLHSYLKFPIFFGQVFQNRKTQEYCIPFFTILYFQSLNIEELLNLERRKLSVLFLVILPGFPTECCVFVTGGCMEHSESVNIIKCHLHSENLCGLFLSSSILLILVCNVINTFTHYFMVNNTGETNFAQWTPFIWHNVGHWAFVT